jgi:hypothetical protein
VAESDEQQASPVEEVSSEALMSDEQDDGLASATTGD